MFKIVITARTVSDVDKSTVSMLTAAGFLIEEYPDVNQYSTEEFIQLLQDADAVIAGVESYTKEILDQTPSITKI